VGSCNFKIRDSLIAIGNSCYGSRLVKGGNSMKRSKSFVNLEEVSSASLSMDIPEEDDLKISDIENFC